MKRLFKTALATALTSVAVVGPAAPAFAADSFGAIAYSSSNGAAGYSWGFGTRELAQTTAIGSCTEAGGTNCRWVLWIQNQWGALATGANRAFGVGWGLTADAARADALEKCIATQATGCGVRRVFHS